MRFRLSHTGIIASALLVTACAALPPHAALPPGAREQLSQTEVVLPIRQHEIYVFVPITQVPNGGLIGALVGAAIDDVRSGKAETAVKPLRNALVDFDFDATLTGDVQTALAKDAFLGQRNVRVIKEITQDNLEKALAGSQAPAVLFAIADYQLSNDADVMDVSLSVEMFANSDALRALAPKPKNPKTRAEPANALYRNSLSFETRIPTDPGGRDAHIATWSANNGEKARAALKLAASKLAMMLAQDLVMTDADGTAAAAAGASARAGIFEGKAIASDDDGTIIRATDGRLFYATKDALAAAR